LLMNTTQFRMTPPSPGCCLKASSMRHIASHDVGAHITLTHSEQRPKQALTRALQAAAAITLLVPATPSTNTIQPSAASSDLHRRL
jgi:DNA repair protein RadC